MSQSRLAKLGLIACFGVLACSQEPAAPVSGSLRATITTTGATLDPDGYSLQLDDGAFPVTLTDTVTVPNLSAGSHDLALNGLATNCGLVSPMVTAVQIVPGREATVRLEVTCDSLLRNGVVFTRVEAGVANGYWMPLTGGTPVLLRVGAAFQVSPDGKRLVYQCSIQLCVENVDGTHPIVLTQEVSSSPSWSPDGQQIAFSRFHALGSIDIYRVRADGTGETPVTDSPGEDQTPVWSPDGTQLAFSRLDQSGQGVWIVNADGTGEVPVPRPPHTGDIISAWAPKADRLLIVRTGPSLNILVTVRVDGSDPQTLSDTTVSSWGASWNPRGPGFVFVSNRIYPAPLFRSDGVGLDVVQLTFPMTGISEWRPQWLP